MYGGPSRRTGPSGALEGPCGALGISTGSGVIPRGRACNGVGMGMGTDIFICAGICIPSPRIGNGNRCPIGANGKPTGRIPPIGGIPPCMAICPSEEPLFKASNSSLVRTWLTGFRGVAITACCNNNRGRDYQKCANSLCPCSFFLFPLESKLLSHGLKSPTTKPTVVMPSGANRKSQTLL